MHLDEYLVGLLVIIQAEPMLIIGLKMNQLEHAKIVRFDSHFLNEDIIVGTNKLVLCIHKNFLKTLYLFLTTYIFVLFIEIADNYSVLGKIVYIFFALLLMKFFYLLFRCSRFETDIPHMKIHKNVRVCRQCYSSIKDQQSLMANND